MRVKAASLASLGIPAVKKRSRVIVETRSVGGVLYQCELVRCGNTRCKRCVSRAVHGPYWYRYSWSAKRKCLVSTYIGKKWKP
jgi:hypothetical protein